ncbi:MAG: hypothetical protein ACR2LK_04970 [Solirubrobacteraceae bacterium]
MPLFVPEMTNFLLPFHGTREELIALAQRWSDEHGVFLAVERFYPRYDAAAVPGGVKLARAVEEFDPVRRMCLCKREFDITAATPSEFLQRNPESLVIILEPLTEDGLRSTAISARMADVDVLRWWISVVREEAFRMHEGAWSTDPETGQSMHVPDHRHMQGAHDLAAGGVRMLAAAGSAVFAFDDLAGDAS